MPLSEWAKTQRQQALQHFYLRDGNDVLVEFDETAVPVMNTQEDGKTYANFRITVDGQDYIWGINTALYVYRQVVKYLAADKYMLRVMRSGNNVTVEPVS
jgi:hypothetical protein